MNAEALRKTAKRIRENPNEYSQFTFGLEKKESCGTVGCIAYHALVANGVAPHRDEEGLLDGIEIEVRARAILGLDLRESDRVFYGPFSWPRKHADRFFASFIARGRANAAAEFLEAVADGEAL